MSIPTRRWTTTDALSHRILDAATETFAARGFGEATMTDVAARSGVGVGSIHRQFGGMRELFLAVFDRLVADVDRHIADTVSPGAGDRSAFEAVIRAYFEALWLHRRVAAVCATADGPPGFDGLRTARMRHALARWAPILAPDPSPQGQLQVRMLESVLAEASSLVVLCDARDEVALITDVTVEAVDRLNR